MLTRIMILTILFATACAPTAVQTSVPLPDRLQGTTEEPSVQAPTASPVAGQGLEKKLTQIVRKDLAVQLGMEIEGVRVIATEPIMWPDAALGCPLPGHVYARGSVPGFRIRLEAESKPYVYHTDRTGKFVLCRQEDPELQDRPAIPVTPGEIDDGQPWVPVD